MSEEENTSGRPLTLNVGNAEIEMAVIFVGF
jgi:hypothetical protein